MADWAWRLIAPWATLPVFAGFFVVSLIFIFVLFPMHRKHYPKGTVTLDANRWGFTVADAQELLGKTLNREQLQVYRRQELVTDMLFPLVYGIGFALAMVMLVRYTGMSRWLIFLPIAAAIADYIENISVATMIGRQLDGKDLGTAASIGAIASRFKHFLLAATVLTLFFLGAMALWRRYA